MLLMLVTSLSMACQQKREWPRITRLMSGAHPNPLIIVGNGAAYGVILQRRAAIRRRATCYDDASWRSTYCRMPPCW